MKNILVIQDLSSYGKCSTTVALPVISCFGITVTVLPTAILSTHSGPEFPGFVCHDLSDHMEDTLKHWQQLGIQFDAVYCGYLGKVHHIEWVSKYLPQVLKPGGLFFLDPVFADHGRFYSGFDHEYVKKLRELIKVSDFLFPNATEASFILGQTYQEGEHDSTTMLEMAKSIQALGCKQVIVTGLKQVDQIGAVLVQADHQTHLAVTPTIGGHYSGTGDLFASLFIGGYLRTGSAEWSLDIAVSLVAKAIQETIHDEWPITFGVHFEKILPDLIQALEIKDPK